MSMIIGTMAVLMIAAVIGVIGGKHHVMDGGIRKSPPPRSERKKPRAAPNTPELRQRDKPITNR